MFQAGTIAILGARLVSLPQRKAMHAPADRRLEWFETGPRAIVTARGPDAIRFCDNFVTAALSRLGPAGATEAFMLDVKGTVLAHVHVFCIDGGLWIDSEGGTDAGRRLHTHLEHYLIRERVDLVDHSNEVRHMVLCGEDADSRARACLEPIEGVLIASLPWATRPMMLAAIPAEHFQAVTGRLEANGAIKLASDSWKRLRIAHGIPSVEDLGDRSLPQEHGRDRVAIAFDKGCYLGQETVARLDALGHVNRRLVRLAIECGRCPSSGTFCMLDGSRVGVLGTVGAATTESAAQDSSEVWALAMLSVAAIRAPDGLSVDGSPARIVPTIS